MFARPGRSVFVCLKCQLRLAEKPQPVQWLPRSDNAPRQSQRRSQSTGAAVAEDLQDHTDEVVTPRPRLRAENKYKGEKVWKPNRTANLGVSSLGKPAEVLLLNERDRPIPEAPADAEEGREGDVLTTAWTTENLLLSPEQLTKNIEHIRDQARQNSERDPDGHRKRLRKRLQEGFSAKQLHNYIEQRQGGAVKPWRTKPQTKHFRYSVKYQMARYIFKHIWAIDGYDAAETAHTGETETSREVAMSSNVLEVLLQADNSSLRQISLDHKVQIDFFRQPAKIIVSGQPKSVTSARQSLLQLQQKVRKHTINFGSISKDRDEVNEWPIFTEIQQMYSVYLTRCKQGIHVHYHEDAPPDLAAIRRHFLLAQRQIPQSSQCTVWPESSRDALMPTQLRFLEQDSSGARRTGKRFIASSEQAATPSMPQMSSQQKSSFTKVYKNSRKALGFPPKQLRLVGTQPGMTVENRASFGQAFVNDGVGAAQHALTTISKTTPSFTSQIPLLSQFLTKRKPWRDAIPQASLSTRSSDSATNDVAEILHPLSQSAQFNYELLLSSAAKNDSSFPPLKIQLLGADVNLGLKQPLQIKAITAVLGERSCYLLLPSQAVDIKFESQILHNVYREGTQPNVSHAKLLSQLAEYFNQAGSLPDPKFAPFTTLNIPTDLRPQKLPIASKRQARELDEDHEYILESAEAMDIASYRPPFLSKLCLEHVVFMDHDGGSSRQLLQLAEQPRLAPPAAVKQKTAFASFFNSAYEVALLLGHPALLRNTKG